MLIEKGTDKAVYTLRVLTNDEPELLGKLFLTIGNLGAGVGDIARVGSGLNHTTRDIDVLVDNDAHLKRILEEVGKLEAVKIQAVYNHVEEMHRDGKIAMTPTQKVRSISDIRKLYTPGVAYICKLIQADESLYRKYTSVKRMVAIVTNGTAILGLGDIGVKAGMPVMEGKALLFNHLAGLSGVPILIDSHDSDEIVRTVANIAKGFGAIKLEDIASPQCFEIEERLSKMLDIPVLHDDQHGTAVVVLASLLNACKYTGLSLPTATIGILGLGAAGMGIASLLMAHGVKNIYGTDIKEPAMMMLKQRGGFPTDLKTVMEKSDIVIATTGCPGLIKPEMIRKRQMIFALSNPNPEIRPAEALAAGAIFAADGRSVNNALAFPGLFKGALDAGARRINNEMKIAAAQAIASEAEEGELVPMLLKEGLHYRVAQKVERAAFESGANLKAS
jgi:malate dehydrogenase (oxaloacetate-decarboxylating)